MIEAVTFDWWDTIALVREDQDRRLREVRIERLLRAVPEFRSNREDLLRAYDFQQVLLEEAWARNVDPDPEEQIRTFLKFARLDPADSTLARHVSEAFGGALLELPPTLFPHIKETLEALRHEGLRIGLISNTGRTWGSYLRRVQDALGLSPSFDVRVFSDEVGVRKPVPRIFEAALDGLGLPAERVVHVGDDAEADVLGAKEVGMRAVWFNPGVRGYRPPHARRPSASADRADAVIRDFAELPPVVERWRA